MTDFEEAQRLQPEPETRSNQLGLGRKIAHGIMAASVMLAAAGIAKREYTDYLGTSAKETTTLAGFDPAIARSATLEVDAECPQDDGSTSKFHGTAGLYEVDGVLEIGTVEHVVNGDGFAPCKLSIQIPTSISSLKKTTTLVPMDFRNAEYSRRDAILHSNRDPKYTITMSSTDFTTTEGGGRDEMLSDARDRFVMAQLPKAGVEAAHLMIGQGYLMPLKLSDAKVEGKNFVLVSRAWSGAGESAEKVQGVVMHELAVDDGKLNIKVVQGNICLGDSGGALIEQNPDGSFTNEVSGVLSTKQFTLRECATLGAAAMANAG